MKTQTELGLFCHSTVMFCWLDRNLKFKLDSAPLQTPKHETGIEPANAELKTSELATQPQLTSLPISSKLLKSPSKSDISLATFVLSFAERLPHGISHRNSLKMRAKNQVRKKN